MTTSPTCFPGSGRDVAGRARGPQLEESLMTLTLVPTASAGSTVTGPRSWVERYDDEHGEFHVAHCTCTWESSEYADPAQAESARTLHDDTHLPPGQPAVTS